MHIPVQFVHRFRGKSSTIPIESIHWFRSKQSTDSGPIRPVIPAQIVHRFRGKPSRATA